MHRLHYNQNITIFKSMYIIHYQAIIIRNQRKNIRQTHKMYSLIQWSRYIYSFQKQHDFHS